MSNADCIAGYNCVDGQCNPAVELRDAGPPGFDAGLLRRDAGRPDAGQPRPDAGYVDTGVPMVDADVPDGYVPDGTVEDAGVCGYPACAFYGATCGLFVDGCGTAIDCGSCRQGTSCGRPGTMEANQCIPDRCTPRQCPSSAECGSVSDGCGGHINCWRSCGSGETCSGNRCVCHPRSCSDRNAECGTIDDGCGGRPNCGSCSGTQTCGNDNQCHCTDQESWTIFHRFKSVRSIGATVSANWVQLNDALQINSQGANVRLTSSQPRSDILYLYDPQLNLPSDATVLGIEVELRLKHRRSASPVPRLPLRLAVESFGDHEARATTLRNRHQLPDLYLWW